MAAHTPFPSTRWIVRASLSATATLTLGVASQLVAQTTQPAETPSVPAATQTTTPQTIPTKRGNANSVPAYPPATNGQPPAAIPAARPADGTALPAIPTGQTAATPVPSQPVAAPGDPSRIPAMPAYDPNRPATRPQAIPAPTPAPAPVASPVATSEKPFIGLNPYSPEEVSKNDWLGSSYIPVDSWVYPAMLRLYSLGYIDSAFLALRPWTRRSILHMLDKSQEDILFDNNEQAVEILDKLRYELRDEPVYTANRGRGLVYGLQSAYVGVRGVNGTVLRDSWHLGQTFINDYGRPYSNGLNSYNGFSTLTEWGPFSLHFRGEYQHAPSYEGYSLDLSRKLSTVDFINYGNLTPGQPNLFGGANRPQATIPEGPVAGKDRFHILEATISAHALNHEISFGKSDAWLGPGLGGAMAWSNNAENMYTFRINRVEPLKIPLLSRLIGPVRYDFFIGSLKGHTYPHAPWAHSEIFGFSPTKNFQLSFQRTIIFGGEGHAPVTLHTFLNGFFHPSGTDGATKYSRNDPGARFSSVTFSYRLPFLRNRATLYTDSETHDDVFPVSAPRRAGWRPGIFISQLPWAHKMDLRVEGTYTDYPTSRSIGGAGNYIEVVQLQGYTNNGFIMGDWIGREAKGGQAWLTYHLSGNESIAFQYLRKKNAKDFIEGGTTQNVYRVDLIKRLNRDLELNAWMQVERWKAPIWKPGQQGNTTGAFQLTWYPGLHTDNR